MRLIPSELELAEAMLPHATPPASLALTALRGSSPPSPHSCLLLAPYTQVLGTAIMSLKLPVSLRVAQIGVPSPEMWCCCYYYKLRSSESGIQSSEYPWVLWEYTKGVSLDTLGDTKGVQSLPLPLHSGLEGLCEKSCLSRRQAAELSVLLHVFARLFFSFTYKMTDRALELWKKANMKIRKSDG